MPQQLMLDPSLLLSVRTFPMIVRSWEREELSGAVLPNSFVRAASRFELTARSLIFFGGRRALPEPKDIARFVEKSGLGEGFRPGREEALGDEIAKSLGDVAKDDLVFRILLEEWLFLNSQSWIASRVRRPFSAFLRAGAVALEFGGKVLDTVVVKTLKIPEGEMPRALTPGQKARAAFKWLAVGGSSATALLEPVTACFVGITSGMFLLFDP